MKRFLLSILALFIIVSPASATFFPDVIVTSSNGIWTDTRAFATLDLAIAAVGAVNKRTIVIPSEQVVAAGLVITDNITLRFERDGAIANVGLLDIQTPNIIADDHQIFTGAGDIDFADGTIVRTSWFVDLDEALDVTTDDTVTMIVSQSETTDDDMAVGNDVTLRWESEFIITVDAGDTLSNVNKIEAGNYQILAGAGDVDFLDGTVLQLNWFLNMRAVVTWEEGEFITLIVTEDHTVDFTDTADNNVSIEVRNGAVLTISIGIVLTVDGRFEPGLTTAIDGAGVVEGLKFARPQWFGAVVDDNTVDSSVGIMAALEAVAPQRGTVLMSSGTYYTEAEITPVSEYYDIVWRGEGRAMIRWNALADATAAVFRATVTTATDFSGNLIENIFFNADDLAGFAFVIEGNAIANGNASRNRFNKCTFNKATVVAFVMGENTEPAVNDSASSLNVFNHCQFGYSPYGVKVNSVNAYENTFNQCQFNSSGQATSNVIQHIRLMYAGMTRINDPEFGFLVPATPGHPHGAADNAYHVYSESPLILKGVYQEDARMLNVASTAHSYNQSITVEGVYTNDSVADANLEDMYFINTPGGMLSVSDASGRSGATGTRRVLLAAGRAMIKNVILGVNGLTVIDNPIDSSIEGMPGSLEALVFPHNVNFQHWTFVDGVDDNPMYWTKRLGTGATSTHVRSAANNVHGDYTDFIDVTVATTNWLVGVGKSVDVGPDSSPFTVIVTGTTDGTDTSIPYIRLNNVTKQQQIIVNADNTFIITGEIDATAEVTGLQWLDIGAAAAAGICSFYIDTVVTVPQLNKGGTGCATAFTSAKHIQPKELINDPVSWDPANLPDGDGVNSANIAVPGAILGDIAVASSTISTQGILVDAYVSANDTTVIRLQNETGGAINLGTSTWRVKVTEVP